MLSRGNSKPLLALISLALIWGYNWVLMKQALTWSAPLDFAALRSVLGGICLLLVLAVWRAPLKPLHWRATLLLGLLQTSGFIGCIALALEFGAVGKSTVLAYTMPFWALGFGVFVLGERLQRLQWWALGLAFIGLIFVLAPWTVRFGTASWLALAAGAFWGISVLLSKRLPVFTTEALINVSAWQMLLGGLALVPLALLFPGRPLDWNWTFVWVLAYNAIPASALAWWLWLYVVKQLPVSVSSLSSLAVPVVSLLLAWWLLGEQPAGYEITGMLLIFAALGILSLAARRIRAARQDYD